MTDFALSYSGKEASRGEIDFYDVAHAMVGFQRSLALTAHLVQNNEIITQAPSLKNARIFVSPPREGSWEVVASAIFGAGASVALAPKDSAAGRMTRRVYDYVLKNALGKDVDFEQAFGDGVEAQIADGHITESKLDSLTEKCENAIIEMHRPIVWSGTALGARVYINGDKDKRVGPRLTPETYEHAKRTVELKTPELFIGMVSSYNANTYKGRIFIPEEGRPIPFELSDTVRNRAVVKEVTGSLSQNALSRSNSQGRIGLKAFRRESSSGRLKSLYVIEIQDII